MLERILNIFAKLKIIIENFVENLSSSFHAIASLQNDLHLLTYFHELNKYYMI